LAHDSVVEFKSKERGFNFKKETFFWGKLFFNFSPVQNVFFLSILKELRVQLSKKIITKMVGKIFVSSRSRNVWLRWNFTPTLP